ncbi:MAG: saccharopine dehydrogenase NADP-binding domain-containing protein [Myxococcota bacterium]|nr:saccharopine dehydrogenase NADP-binding domain-containing protein [Myxococcota bacterium]
MTSTPPRRRDRSRAHDVVLFGATGFTGALVAEYLARHHAGSGARIALAGRDRAKLEKVRESLRPIDARAAEWPLLVADAHDEAALGAIAEHAEVVCTTVGPYAKYGGPLVAACVRNGTDYCDLTGEVQFIARMIAAHHDDALRSGARIVHCCGFDSIPSDLGTLMLQEAMRERHGGHLQEVKFFAGESRGGASGGTIASMLHLVEESGRDREVRRIMADPYALVPREARGQDGADQLGVRFDRELGMWTAPFVMAAINTRVVRRSNYLMDQRYGRDFRYSEVMSTGRGPKGALTATAITAGLGAFLAGVSVSPLRSLIAKRLPKPGEGPDREARERGFFVVRLIGTGRAADGREITLRGRVEGKADPGYGETAKMLSESALCLALDGASLDAPGGIRTPASTMGMRLVDRLRAAGMVFTVEET